MIHVMLVDDHALVRSGIKRLLQDVPGIEVIAEAGSGEEAIDLVRRYRPHVVLMDVSMPGIGGLEATRRLLLLNHGLKLIVLTAHTNEIYPKRFLRIGALGYINKGCTVDEMVMAIRSVAQGERYLSSDVAMQVAMSALPVQGKSSRVPFDSLSQRELQVMMMVTRGHKVQEISDQLCLSPKTVSTYRSRLLSKLGVHTDVELSRLAVRYGVIEDV